jgi:uncharacterized protein (TIGR02217 family)
MSLPIFPELPTMAWNSQKTQRWDTIIQKSGSGRRKSFSRWAYPEWVIDCSYTCLDTETIKKAYGFFAMVRGQFQPFLWKDPEDYQETKVRIGTGNGANKTFQLLRAYGGLYTEPVRDIVSGTLKVLVNDLPVTAALGADGQVALAAPPANGAAVTASFEYYWRVAFDGDELTWTNFWYGFYRLNKVTMVTVR